MGTEHASASVRPWMAGGADAEAGQRAGAVRGACARDVAARRRSSLNVPMFFCSKLKNSKFLYTSAPNIEYESWRSQTHLQLSQRLYGVFLNRFFRKGLQTLNATQLPGTEDTDI
jgi:hypothetical protein